MPQTFKKSLLLLMSVVCSGSMLATGIRFEKLSFAKVLEKAAKEKKMIFMDCVTTWCPPCKRMVQHVFTNDTIGDFYNAQFICVSINMEKGEGPTLASKYQIGCYPTYLFLDEKGNMVHRQCGEMSVVDFLALGKAAFVPEKQFRTIEQHCKSGKASSAEMLRYIEMRADGVMPVDSMLGVYMQTQTERDFLNRENWTLLHKHFPNPDNLMFRYILNHQQEFSEKYTTDSVRQLVAKVYSYALITSLSPDVGSPDTITYLKRRKEIIDLNLSYLNHLVPWYDLNYYLVSGNKKMYAKAAFEFIRDNADSTDFNLTNHVLYDYYQNVTDTAYLDSVMPWAALSVAHNTNYSSTRNYAHLLFNRGRIKEAKEQATLALQFAKKEPFVVVEEEIEQLKKIQKY